MNPTWRQQLEPYALATAMCLLIAPLYAPAQTVDNFDPGNGPAVSGYVYSTAMEPDGSILVGGNFSMLGGQLRTNLCRLNSTGMADPAFAPGPRGTVFCLAVQPDGWIIAGGSFTTVAGTGCTNLCRLNHDGTRDADFNPGPNGTVYCLAFEADGKVLLAGSFTTVAGIARNGIARLNTDGSLDGSFNPGADGTVYSLSVQDDGKIVVGGHYSTLGGQPRVGLGRLTSEGIVDTNFVCDVISSNYGIYTTALQPNGQIVVGGFFTNLAGVSRTNLARVNATGSVDSTFNPGANSTAYSLALQADGRILGGGAFTQLAGQSMPYLGRLNSNGTLDSGFNAQASTYAYSLALQEDGDLLVGGNPSQSFMGFSRKFLGRLINTDAATTRLGYDGHTLTWSRGGCAPTADSGFFQVSSNGVDWNMLGVGTRVPGGWALSSLNLPTNLNFRAVGFVRGGNHSGSTWAVRSVSGPPIINRQPASVAASAGTTVAFSTFVEGSEPMACQWWRNTSPVTGATNSELVFPSVSPNQQGDYWLVVSNSYGSRTSQVATLTVTVPPNPPFAATQTAQPVRATSATLNGMATPNGPETFAWFEWGADLNYGHTTPVTNIGNSVSVVRLSAVLPGLAPGSSGHYRLVASNSFGVTYGWDRQFTTGTRVAVWGSAYDGNGNAAVPAALTNIVAIAAGHYHSLALRSDGTVTAWGAQTLNYGQTNVPATLSNVVAIAGGFLHSLALREDGTVVKWGSYVSPQAGDIPAGLSNVIAIAGGDSHGIALQKDGQVVVWGDNDYGRLNVPFGLSNVVEIAAGSKHCLVLRADGTVLAWGTANDGSPQTPPPGLSNVVMISTETWHNLVQRRDGSLVAWGSNQFGQTNNPSGVGNFTAIATGWEGSMGLKPDGNVLVWGRNSSGQTNVPAGLGNVVLIASGDLHCLALSAANAAPATSPRSVTGYPNLDLAITLRGWDPNGDSITLRVGSLPLTGTLFQYSGTGRGNPITLADTAITDVMGRLVFVPAAGTYGAPYTTFTYLANDGLYDSAPSAVSVKIVPPPALQSAGSPVGTNSPFSLSFLGLSNATYSVYGATNLSNWLYLGTASQPSPGQFIYADTASTNLSRRFYRVRSP